VTSCDGNPWDGIMGPQIYKNNTMPTDLWIRLLLGVGTIEKYETFKPDSNFVTANL